MKTDSNFVFRVNVSNDSYTTKSEASACLSRAGAEAVGKVKMAFRETSLTVDQFLQQALTGHSFCNLFDYDPNQKYWIETSGGKRYQSYPVYRQGHNKGCMKLNFKSDRFFRGSQTVFVDIDYTRFKTIPEYLDCLTLKPTCAYMSYSDGLEKSGKTSRRFRMVYVFDRILGKDDLNVVSRCITHSIVRDTGESMEDDCGERPSQYFNGVYGNEECYTSGYIYSRLDFPDSLPEIDESQCQLQAQDPNKPIVQFDGRLLYDMSTMDYDAFMSRHCRDYEYFYRTERPDWVNNTYQLTDENYLQLWWPTEIITDGNHRRRKLFKRACLRRLINSNVDANTLLFNLYIDRHKFIDNSDHVITLDVLKRRVERAMQMDWDKLQEYCEYEIAYWKDHRQKFILHPNVPHTQEYIRFITKEVHFAELDGKYDRSKTVMENLALLDGESQSTLYRYCHERGIPTNPTRTMTEAQMREAKRQAKTDVKAWFMQLYDPSLSAAKNREIMMQNGIEISESTIRNWSKDYVTPDMLTPTELQAPMNIGYNWDSILNKTANSNPNCERPTVHVPESLLNFGHENREYGPNYAELERIWYSQYDR